MTPFGPGILMVADAVWTTVVNLRRKGLPRIQLYAMLKPATSNVSISLRLFFPDPRDTSRSMLLIGVDDYPGMIS
jgi:hypothetical protein